MIDFIFRMLRFPKAAIIQKNVAKEYKLAYVRFIMLMLRSTVLSKSILLLSALLLIWNSAVSATPLLPLVKGTSWIYEGRVDWTEEKTIKSRQMRWATKIIDVFDYDGVRVAVVSGLPSDLDWYKENKPVGYGLLVATSTDAYYLNLEITDKKEAYRLARDFRHNPKKHLESVNSFISDSSATCKNPNIIVKGFNPKGKVKCRQTTERTNPDIQTIDFTYGLGIVRYYYEHFGTVSKVDMELKEVRFPRK